MEYRGNQMGCFVWRKLFHSVMSRERALEECVHLFRELVALGSDFLLVQVDSVVHVSEEVD